MMKKMNKDVPDSAVIRQLSIENGKLKAEIDFLREELDRKNKAIEAFKKWQSKVATFHVNYWLTDGIRLIDNPPSAEAVRKLRRIISKTSILDGRMQSIERSYQSLIDHIQNASEDEEIKQLRDNLQNP